MKKYLLFSIGFISLNFFFVTAHAVSERKIFIMLNVDNTIVDRIDECDTKQISTLQNSGIVTQKLEFYASNTTSPKFISMYEKLAKGENSIAGESDYMTKISVEKTKEGSFHITECLAIRPSTQILLERLNDFELPIIILLTSRNDDARTKNLQANLNLQIDERPFSEVTTFIPRDWFRIKIKTSDGKEASAKSAIELRNHYSIITKEDYVILLDHIADSRFIKSNEITDLHIAVSKFIAKDEYDSCKEQQEVDSILNKIRDFINISNVH